MKKNTLLTLFATSLLLSACTKDPKTTVINEFSATRITTTVNTLSTDTTAWKATSVGTGFKPISTKDTLFVLGVENNLQANAAYLTIALKQKGAGTYKGNDIKAYFYYVVGGDAVTARYSLDPNADNQVIITGYDVSNHRLQGTFNLTFINAFVNYTTIKVKLMNGKINMPLIDQFTDPIKY